ncbi:MAG: energy transducer TonB [Acidaminococcaceae bacterium]
MRKGKRFRIGFIASCSCHILLIVLLGVIGIMHVPKPYKDDIMVVNLVGGTGGGGVAAAEASQLTTNISRTKVPDEIINFRKANEIDADVAKEPEKKILENKANNSAEIGDFQNYKGANGENGSNIGESSNGQGDGISEGSDVGTGGAGQPLVPPRLVHYEKPAYPSAARKSGVEGTVIVRVLVDKRGDVSGADIYESSGSPILDEKAVSAAQEWEFAPAKDKMGRNMKCYVFVPISFFLR